MLLSFELMMLGIFTLIYFSITLFVGIKIITKYFEVRDKSFLYAGLSVIGLATPWAGVVLNFISFVLFDTIPPMELHFFLHGVYIPIATCFWLMILMHFSRLSETLRKKLIIFCFVCAFIFEIVYIFIIFTDTTILGTLLNEIQVDYATFSEIYLLIATLIALFTGLWLGTLLRKSDKEKVRLQGKLIIYSYCIFAFAAFFEVMVPIISVIIFARILVTIMSILFYGAFVLPKWITRLFLRHKNQDVLEVQEEYEEPDELKDDALEFFKIISQRRNVTANEVNFYRDRDICLVCKGKVEEDNAHTCTKCYALYCERCALAIAQLENSCWACNKAIDHSKPVKLIESEKERKKIIVKLESAKKENS